MLNDWLVLKHYVRLTAKISTKRLAVSETFVNARGYLKFTGFNNGNLFIFQKKVSVLLIAAACLQRINCRRLPLADQLDNEIDTSNVGIVPGRSRDWVKISESPSPIISRKVGSRIELECEAMGSPAPVMQWLKGNTPLTEVSRYIKLRTN